MSGWRLVRERACVADTVVTAAAVLLATMCLIPLFADLTWVLPAVVMVLVVACVGSACRGLDMPVPLVPLAEALAIVLFITGTFAAQQAWAGLVPTSDAWDVLRALLRQGLVEANTLTAPVPAFPGLVVMTLGGVGLAALSADTLFVSVRWPVVAGLPLLALYLAPAFTLSSGARWWSLPLAATGWLMILAADQRDGIRRWSGLPATTRIRGLSTAARRAGLIAVAIATVAAVVLPVRSSAPWRSGEGSGPGGPAASGPVILDPLVSMRRSLLQTNDTEVLSYRTQADRPSYLRVSALETFDGTTWSSRALRPSETEALVPLPGNVLSATIAASEANRVKGGASFTYIITVDSLQNLFLPLPYPITEVNDVSGLATGWRFDARTGVASSDETPATGITYRVAALDPGIRSAQLRDAAAPQGSFEDVLAVPEGMAPEVTELASQVTARASTPYDKAVALQRWFTRDGGFEYSTSVRSGADADYIAEFLQDRVGYCEQFAASMAVMARTLGIPARVVVGFTQGSKDEDDTWHVTVRDAHAWPELWFEGVGWVRFEPTPRTGGNVRTPEYAVTPNTGGVPAGGPDEGRNFRDLEGFVPGGAGDGAGGPVIPPAPLAALVAIIVLLLLSVPMVRRQVRRRRRLHAGSFPAVVGGAWVEIADLAVDLGQPWSDFGTPRQCADRLSEGLGASAVEALMRVRREVEQVRYAPPSGSSARPAQERAEAVRADVAAVARDLRSRVRWQARVVSYCWPPSDRRRQRSSMRSMKPGAFDERGDGSFAGASASSTGRALNAE